MSEVVWLTEERIYAILVKRHAHFSVVRYYRGGIDFEIEVLNDEIREDHAIECEPE